jgi:NADH-ubiquinone oxidoreductase chain 6
MGNIMYTSHSIWLIVVSVILLLAMVGSIIVTLDTKKNTTLKGAVISNS